MTCKETMHRELYRLLSTAADIPVQGIVYHRPSFGHVSGKKNDEFFGSTPDCINKRLQSELDISITIRKVRASSKRPRGTKPAEYKTVDLVCTPSSKRPRGTNAAEYTTDDPECTPKRMCLEGSRV